MKFYMVESDEKLTFTDEIAVYEDKYIYQDGFKLKIVDGEQIFKFDSNEFTRDKESYFNWCKLVEAFKSPKDLRFVQANRYDVKDFSIEPVEGFAYKGELLVAEVPLSSLPTPKVGVVCGIAFFVTNDGMVLTCGKQYLKRGYIRNLGDYGSNLSNMGVEITPCGDLAIVSKLRDEDGNVVGFRDTHKSPLSQEILRYLDKHPCSTVQEIRKGIRHPRHSVTARITEMSSYGYVVPCGLKKTVGNHKGTAWRVAEGYKI